MQLQWSWSSRDDSPAVQRGMTAWRWRAFPRMLGFWHARRFTPRFILLLIAVTTMAVTRRAGVTPRPADLSDVGAEFLDPRFTEENLQRTAGVGLLGLHQAAVDPGMDGPGMHPQHLSGTPERI